MKINVVTYASKGNGIAYAEYCYCLLNRMKSGKHHIDYRCITPDVCPQNWQPVLCNKKHQISNSMTHGNALSEYFEAVDTSYDYHLVIDADVGIVYKNWDEVLIRECNKYDFWGFQPPSGSKRGAHDFPCVFFIAFKTDNAFPPMIMDFRPLVPPGDERVARMLLESEFERTVYGVDKHGFIKCDTGYRLPYFAKKAGNSASVCKYVRQDFADRKLPYLNNENKKLCMEKPTHMAEWHYNGELFGTHKQACRNHPITVGYGLAWKQRIGAYIGSISK